jgi:hypothetical protein
MGRGRKEDFEGKRILSVQRGGEGEPEQKPQPVLEPIENPTRKIEVWSAQEVTPPTPSFRVETEHKR